MFNHIKRSIKSCWRVLINIKFNHITAPIKSCWRVLINIMFNHITRPIKSCWRVLINIKFNHITRPIKSCWRVLINIKFNHITAVNHVMYFQTIFHCKKSRRNMVSNYPLSSSVASKKQEQPQKYLSRIFLFDCENDELCISETKTSNDSYLSNIDLFVIVSLLSPLHCLY